MKVHILTLWDDPDCGNYQFPLYPGIGLEGAYWLRVGQSVGWIGPSTPSRKPSADLGCDDRVFYDTRDTAPGTLYGQPVVCHAGLVTRLGHT